MIGANQIGMTSVSRLHAEAKFSSCAPHSSGAEDAYVVRRKRLPRLLGELDDDEVALLDAYGRSYTREKDAFSGIDRPEPADVQIPREVHARERLYDSGEVRLLDPGSLKKSFAGLKRANSQISMPRRATSSVPSRFRIADEWFCARSTC